MRRSIFNQWRRLEGRITPAAGLLRAELVAQGAAASAKSGSDHGVILNEGAAITANGNGQVIAEGRGGGTPDSAIFGAISSYGVYVRWGNTKITSAAGDVSITAVGGPAKTQNQLGLWVDAGKINAGGVGNVSITADGGNVSTGLAGTYLNRGASVSAGGNVTITGLAGANAKADRVFIGEDTKVVAGPAGQILIVSDRLTVLANSLIDAGGTSVTIQPRTAGRGIVLGSTAGAITINGNITRSTPTLLTFVSSGDVLISGGSINSANALVVFTPGVNSAVYPTFAGVDVVASTVSVTSGRRLRIAIDGPSVDVQYSQLNVIGGVDLTGAILELSGTYVPLPGDKFTIVANDGVDAVLGTLKALPEGTVITQNGTLLRLSYQGATGNDVVFTAPLIPTATVQVNDGTVQRSRVTSLTVTFDAVAILPANPAAAFQLVRASDGAIVALNASVSGQVVTLSFTGVPLNANSLADGKYTLTVLSNLVNNGNFDGNGDGTPGDDYQFGFHRLFGDADGDGDVDSSDYAAFRTSYGGANNIYDFDNDGDVDTSDFGQFRLRYGMVL